MVTLLGGLLAMLLRVLDPVAQLATSPSGLTALAGTVLAGAMLVAVLALIASVAFPSQESDALPLIRRASALREKSWRAAFLRSAAAARMGPRRSRPRAGASSSCRRVIRQRSRQRSIGSCPTPTSLRRTPSDAMRSRSGGMIPRPRRAARPR